MCTGQNWLEFTPNTVTDTAQVQVDIVAEHITSVLFLVQFNNFALTMGFCWSNTLLL